jgi:alpha-L-rhamnosidase
VTARWRGSFITAADRGTEPGSPAPLLRRAFTVEDGLVAATLHVSALGIVEAHLNGTVVGDEVLTPGWTSYRHRLVVSSHDVTGLLTTGANALGAVVGEGWAVGRLGWNDRRQVWADRPAAYLQLELDYGDRTELVVSDGTWRSGTGGSRSDSIYDGETFDARLEPDGWSRPGFDDATWGDVEVVTWDVATLVSPTAPPIRRIEELPAVEVLTTPTGRTVVDFGQILTGWVRLAVEGPAGTTVTLHHCETLIDGEPEFETNRTALATDRYTLRGGGPEVWAPRFTFHGFRYVEVDGWPGEVTADQLRAIVVHSDLRRIGWFDSSDELLNKLHDNVVWSMRGNFVGIPTDCPQRDERLGWTGDINAFGPTAAFLYDVSGVLGSWLEDLALEQAEHGSVPWTVPDVGGRRNAPTALWADVAVSLPVCLYEAYGDTEVLERQYPSMQAYLDEVEPLLDQNGAWTSGFQFGDWCDPDARPDNPSGAKADPHLVATAFLTRVTGEMARAAELLGHPADAERYQALHDRVRNGFRTRWVTPAGLVADPSPTAYALAICFGVLDADQEAEAGARLAALVNKAGHHIATGFAGTPYVTEALSRTGHLDTAYALLMQTGCPSFLYPVTMGATTIWERWDAITPDGSLNRTGMTSLNHYALGAVAAWLHREVAGLAPAEPGYRTLRVAPKPGGGLTRAEAIHDTPRGRARSAWQIDDGGDFTLEVTVPGGASAEVVLPRHPDALTETVGEGDHRWSYPWPRGSALSLRSKVSDLRSRPLIWEPAREAVLRHFNMDLATSSDLAGITVRDLLGAAAEFNAELHAELTELLDPVIGPVEGPD